MAQTGKSRQYRSTGKSEYRRSDSRSAYVAGNTVRKLDVVEEIHKPRKQELSHAVKKNRDKAVYMNLGCAVFERLPACGGHCFDWIYPSAVGDYRKRKAHCGDGKHAEQPEGIQ